MSHTDRKRFLTPSSPDSPENIQQRTKQQKTMEAEMHTMLTNLTADMKLVAKKEDIEAITQNFTAIKKDISDLQLKCHQLEQKFLCNEIVIPGLPKNSKEYPADLKQFVINLYNKLAIDLDINKEVKSLSLIASKKDPNKDTATLFIKFYSERPRAELFRKMREIKSNNADPVILSDLIEKIDPKFAAKEPKPRPLLSKYNQELRRKAFEHKDQFKYIWSTEDGKIMLKTSDVAVPIHLTTENQLEELVKMNMTL